MNVAIIPARGGSKRIPGKNIKPFCGRPIIAYSIAAAQQSGLFDRIICSTDSDEISDVARRYGAEVPFQRPAELANDFAGTDAVLIHSLNWLAEQGEPADYACCLYPTAPFIQVEHLRSGFELLRTQQAASTFSVATYPYAIFRSLKLNAQGRIEWIWPENQDKRSQDFPEAFHDAGQFYWFDVRKCLQSGTVLSDDAVPVIIPRYLVQDIDTPEDWETAELLFQAFKNRK